MHPGVQLRVQAFNWSGANGDGIETFLILAYIYQPYIHGNTIRCRCIYMYIQSVLLSPAICITDLR